MLNERVVFCSEGLYEGGVTQDAVDMKTSLAEGMGGKVWCDRKVVLTGETFTAPIAILEDLNDNRTIW